MTSATAPLIGRQRARSGRTVAPSAALRAARAGSGTSASLVKAIATAPQMASQATKASSQRSARAAAVQRSTAAGRGRRGLRMSPAVSDSALDAKGIATTLHALFIGLTVEMDEFSHPDGSHGIDRVREAFALILFALGVCHAGLLK